MYEYKVFPLKCPHCNKDLPIWNCQMETDDGKRRYECNFCNGDIYLTPIMSGHVETDVPLREVVELNKKIEESVEQNTLSEITQNDNLRFGDEIEKHIDRRWDEEYSTKNVKKYGKPSFAYCRKCGVYFDVKPIPFTDNNEIKYYILNIEENDDGFKSSGQFFYPFENDLPIRCPICYSKTYNRKEKNVYSTEKKYIDEWTEAQITDFVQEGSNQPINAVNKDKIDVKEYISNYVCLEKNILFFKYLIEEIAFEILRTQQLNIRSAYDIREKITDIVKEYPFKPLKVNDNELGLTPPKSEEMEEYSNSIFVNNSEIYDRNTAKRNRYKDALESYRRQLATKREEYIEKLKTQNEEIFDARIQKIEPIRNELVKARDSGERYAFLHREFDEAVNRLKDLCILKGELLNMNIIYPKYIDFMIMSTLDDYFKSGRVTELEGPYGAYNLYENELRANTIISRLDDVIDNLEKIRQNQYSIYMSISSIDASINKMTGLMRSIESNTSRISHNTEITAISTSITAYNTEKIAAYSKINAELTGAVAMISAFK